MRLMTSTHPTDIVVPAAHSRVVRPGEVVDFDETIHAKAGGSYSLEVALSEMAAGFVAAEPQPEPAAAISEATTEEAPPASGPGEPETVGEQVTAAVVDEAQPAIESAPESVTAEETSADEAEESEAVSEAATPDAVRDSTDAGSDSPVDGGTEAPVSKAKRGRKAKGK